MVTILTWLWLAASTIVGVSGRTEAGVQESIEVNYNGANQVVDLAARHRADRQRARQLGRARGNGTRPPPTPRGRRSSVRTPRRTVVPESFICRDDWDQNIGPNWGGEKNGGCEHCFLNEIRKGHIMKMQQNPIQQARGGEGQNYYCIDQTAVQEAEGEPLYIVCSEEGRQYFYECKFPVDFFDLEDKYREKNTGDAWMPFEFQCSLECREPDHAQHVSPVRSQQIDTVPEGGDGSDSPTDEDPHVLLNSVISAYKNGCPAPPENQCNNNELVKLGPLKDFALGKAKCHCQGVLQRLFPWFYITLPGSLLPFAYTYVKKNYL